jgi:hypothetical protein
MTLGWLSIFKSKGMHKDTRYNDHPLRTLWHPSGEKKQPINYLKQSINFVQVLYKIVYMDIAYP